MIWNEFDQNWEKLAFESERLMEKMTGKRHPKLDVNTKIPRERLVKHSSELESIKGFSEPPVLAAYGARCCITGLSIPQLLNASHIVPVEG